MAKDSKGEGTDCLRHDFDEVVFGEELKRLRGLHDDHTSDSHEARALRALDLENSSVVVGTCELRVNRSPTAGASKAQATSTQSRSANPTLTCRPGEAPAYIAATVGAEGIGHPT